MKGFIIKPCHKEWEDLQSIDNCSFAKYCSTCKKEVFNYDDLKNSKNKKLSNIRNQEICVRMSQKESNNNYFTYQKIKRFGTIGLIAASLLLSIDSFSQSKKPSTFKYSQIETISETTIISGKILGKKKLGWRKLNNAEITIYSDNKKIDSCFSNEKGEFIIEINKKILANNISIEVDSENYKTFTIKEIPAKNTGLKIYLREEMIEFVTGRFF